MLPVLKIVTLQDFQVGEALFRATLVDPDESADSKDRIEIPIKVLDGDQKEGGQEPLEGV